MEPSAETPEPQWHTGPGLLESVWRYRWLVGGALVLAALVGFAASFLQPTMYEAEARMLLTDPSSTGIFDEESGGETGNRYVRNQAESADSPQVYMRASDRLDGQLTWEEVEERVAVRPATDVDLLTVVGRSPTPDGAAALTNAVAEAYQELRTEDVRERAETAVSELEETMAQLRERVDAAEARLEDNPDDAQAQAERDAAAQQLITFESRADQIHVDATLFGSGVERFTEARPPEDPAQPQPLRNSAVAAVLGLLAASALAWWRAEQTQAADRRQDAAPVLRAPLLAQVPDFKAVGVTGLDPARSTPHSPAAESYQFLVSSLEYALAQVGDGGSVVVTSAGPADGKTLTAFNLAIAATRDGRRVVLCDTDERVRGLTGLAGTASAPGITDLADDDVPIEGCIAHVPVPPGDPLPFVPCGTRPPDPAGFFRTPGFRTALARVKQRGDLVVLDSPPILAVADTSAIAGQVDGIIVVVAKGTPLKTLEEVRERLEFVGTPVLGYVFNRADVRGGSYGYGYGYEYGYGYSDGREGPDPVAAGPPPARTDTEQAPASSGNHHESSQAPERAGAEAPASTPPPPARPPTGREIGEQTSRRLGRRS